MFNHWMAKNASYFSVDGFMDTLCICGCISATEHMIATLQVPLCSPKNRQSCGTNNSILWFRVTWLIFPGMVTYALGSVYLSTHPWPTLISVCCYSQLVKLWWVRVKKQLFLPVLYIYIIIHMYMYVYVYICTYTPCLQSCLGSMNRLRWATNTIDTLIPSPNVE